MVLTTAMDRPDAFSGAPAKLRRSRRLSSTRGLLKSNVKSDSCDSSYEKKIVSPPGDSKSKLISTATTRQAIPDKIINWELNERISLSSDSSAGVEIRSNNPKKPIGFGDGRKIESGVFEVTKKTMDAVDSTIDRSEESTGNVRKKTLELLNVSGFDKSEKLRKIDGTKLTSVDVFRDSWMTTGNVIKNDSKYEIGVPGECTMMRKKKNKQSRTSSRSIETKITSLNNDRNDLTGTSVRRRWNPTNDDSNRNNDSITKRLELIHELNQKILANYQRFQQKSKKPYGKSFTTANATSSPKNNLKNNGNEVSRCDFEDCSVDENRSSREIDGKRRNKISGLRQISEKPSCRRIKEEASDDNGENSEVSRDDRRNVDRSIGRSSRDRLENARNKSRSSVSRALRNLNVVGTTSTTTTKPSKKSPVGQSSNVNFSLAVKPEFHGETKILGGRQCESPIKKLRSKFEEAQSYGGQTTALYHVKCNHRQQQHQHQQHQQPNDDSRRNISNKTKSANKIAKDDHPENSRLHPTAEKNICRSFEQSNENDEKLSSINENGKKIGKTIVNNDDSTNDTKKCLRNEESLSIVTKTSTKIDETKNSTETTRQEILEKEILDNLNETIDRFDNEIETEESDGITDIRVDDAESREEGGSDGFSTDSIQSTGPNPKAKSTEDEGEDTCLRETFNSSWDSGVGADAATGNGWVRIHTGIESSLVYLTLDTTAKDICRDMLLGDDLALFVQIGGEPGRRMAPHERPLEYQDEFLKQLGYEEISRRARLGVDPELRHLIAYHVGPTSPQPDLTGYSRCGHALVLKGLVFPQWKRRSLAVIGSRLFLYPSCPDSRPEWMELGGGGGSVCYAPSRLGKLVLRVTGFPRITIKHRQNDHQSEIPSHHHQETRHLYLGFQHPWDRDLWRGWLKQATQMSTCPKLLDLSKGGLSRIPESTLAFPAVEEIFLARNQLNNSESNLSILTRFPRLRAVRMECNQLKSIPNEFLKLCSLTALDLSDNKIEQVPTEIRRLVNLEELILDRNVIEKIPEEVGELQRLTILSLAGNRIAVLPCFFTMRALALTDVLTKVDNGKNFKDDKNTQNNLHKVNLRNNQLKGNIILGNYGNLTHLDVSENSIEKLDVSALHELQSARCARNSLTELTVCGRNLVSLIAGNNKLKKLTIDPIPTNLEHLDVSYNSLDALPEWTPDLPVLRALFASHNALTALPDRLLSQPSRLEVLHLPHNRLQALPPPRKPLNIVHLTLQGNALTALPTSFFPNTERMKVLNLSNNRLSELPYTDEGCKNRQSSHALEKLYLTGNCLTDTALDALAKLPALRVLHLAYNVLDTLPESCIGSWPDLEELVMSGNRLQYLPDNVANLRHLRVLRVHSNRLLNCPTFNKTTSLMVLDLAHNQLDRINLATLVPPQLQFLDISCNSRLHVDPRQFQVYRSQRPVSLVDVSGQNRPSLPSHPHQQDIVRSDKGGDQPWRLGFSETAGTRERLHISQVRMPSFCNVEGLFGIFDGGTNQEAPNALQEMLPRLLLEERTVRETAKDYLKYTLLSAHRELKENGQKYGIDATIIHITRLPSSQGYPRMTKKYCLRIASSGETRAVLCRAAGPLVLAPMRKNLNVKRQLGNSSMFPTLVPDPTVEEVTLEEDDEFFIIANRKLWEVLSVQEAVREARAEASPVLAAKRLQDLAQAYGAEDNISIIVVRLTGPGNGDLDQLMRELRNAVTKNRGQGDGGCSCPCCVPPNHHKPPTPCCCHVNEGYYLNGVLKNIVNRPGNSHNGSGRFFKNVRNTENPSPPYNDDRSSPSGQSDQTSDSAFKIRQSSNRTRNGSAASRAVTKNRQSIVVHDNVGRKTNSRTATHDDGISERSGALSEEQFRCWEYMLEQNTQLLFDKELDTLARVPLRRGQSRSTPHLAANLPFLSKRFGSARSFNPGLPRATMRFGSGRRFLNGGPNAAYFGSLQRLMPYNLEYDFAVIQERGGLDSLEQDASRMQQYWGVATTEL